ncbi:uncharacterized protein [Musca autumnalis]|uniref:uncharacterized protein n=1 Tax=Musca autumnalis TaxID=221902 RepID=UPI003CF5CB72
MKEGVEVMDAMASVPHTDGQNGDVEMRDGVRKKLIRRKDGLRDKFCAATSVNVGGSTTTDNGDGAGVKRVIEENGGHDNATNGGGEVTADLKKRRFNDEVVLYTTEYKAFLKNHTNTWTAVLSILDTLFGMLMSISTICSLICLLFTPQAGVQVLN